MREHTFCSAIHFSSLTVACTVAILPVPETPEMSVQADQLRENGKRNE
jgi:hypothetical protein